MVNRYSLCKQIQRSRQTKAVLLRSSQIVVVFLLGMTPWLAWAAASLVAPSPLPAFAPRPAPVAQAPLPQQADNSLSQEQSLNQFQQWLDKNGYNNANSNNNAPTDANVNNNPAPQTAKVYPPITFQESQQSIVNNFPSGNLPPNPDSDAAFNSMLQQNMPLTPQQVIQLKQQIDLAQRAAATPPTIPPKPVSSTIMVNLAPGATPPAVRLAQGYVTSLVFVDSTGAPWPITSFDIGNPKAINMQWDGKSNILLMQAITPYSNGDIVVRLAGLDTPITLELVSGQRLVDYRVDLHISGFGPNAKDMSVDSGLPPSANQLLLGVLDGVAPAGSKMLNVSGAGAQAWLLNDKIYFRTRFTVLSPGWVGKMVSPDGMNAYELPKTSSILISRYGEPAELKLEGF